jgi:carbonic anhydrase
MKKNRDLVNSKISYILGLLIAGIAVFASSFYFKKPHIFNKEQQKDMSPNQVLQDLIDGNKRFYSNTPLKRESLVAKSQKASVHGQFPKAVILACMDSRSIPEITFDQTIGDLFTLRVAGNVVNKDMLASLEFATKHSGSKVIVVMGHTQCGAIKAVCEGNLSGNLESLAHAIEPAIAIIQKQNPGQQLDCTNDLITKNIALQNVRNMIALVIKGSPVIRELISQGSIKIIGALHDLSSGVVTFEKELEP